MDPAAGGMALPAGGMATAGRGMDPGGSGMYPGANGAAPRAARDGYRAVRYEYRRAEERYRRVRYGPRVARYPYHERRGRRSRRDRPLSGRPRLNWDTGTWDGGFWDAPSSDYFLNRNQPKKQHNMKRQTYYPSRIGDQVNWLDNYSVKLPVYGPTLGVVAGDVTASVSDAKWANYVLGTWLSAVRAFSPSTTDAVDDVLTGSGPDPVTLPSFTAPALPAGVTARLPGALLRIFTLVAKIKLAGSYTEAIGTDLGVIGQEETARPAPKFTATLEQGPGCQCVRLVFFKYNHMGVSIESRRGGTDWQFLAVDTESPYLDERALLVTSQPEVREYRMRFWDKGTPNGDWTDVVKVTVSP